MSAKTSALRRFAARARTSVANSAWAPLALKVGFGFALFLGLALVGSGAALGVLPAPVAPLGAPQSSASAPVESQTAVENAADAGSVDSAIGDSGSDAGAVTSEGKVILNLATEDDLRRLPGIGPTRAHAIVLLRGRLGKLKRAEDLLRVKGIGRRLLGRIRPLVLVDPPPS